MEWAAVAACGTMFADLDNFLILVKEPVLPKGFATVGYHVDVKVHLKSTLLHSDFT